MTLVNVETGEVVEQMTEVEAHEFVAFIRAAQEELPRRIVDAWRRRVWIPLGYASWDDMCVGEGIQLRLPRDERQPFVMELRAAGMSTRAIAPVVGVSHETAAADLRDQSPVRNLTPDQQSVTGLDGRVYGESRDPEPTGKASSRTRPRRAFIDEFFDAAYDLVKAAERIERLAADDRFTRYTEQVATKHRSDLLKAAAVLADVLARLPNNGKVTAA